MMWEVIKTRKYSMEEMTKLQKLRTRKRKAAQIRRGRKVKK